MKERYTIIIEKVLGVKRDSTIYGQVFPQSFDFFVFLILSFFVYFISKKSKSN